MARENKIQKRVIDRLKSEFPGCLVLKNDSGYIQGIPDILVLFRNTWAALEVKKSPESGVRPNQEHYVDVMNGMSFASFVHPDNEDEVFRALQQTFKSRRKTRISQP